MYGTGTGSVEPEFCILFYSGTREKSREGYLMVVSWIKEQTNKNILLTCVKILNVLCRIWRSPENKTWASFDRCEIPVASYRDYNKS